MKTIFRSENVSVIDDESGTDESLTVTVNTSMGQALFSLGCEIKRLQEKLDEANKRISNGLDALDGPNFEDIPYNVSCALTGGDS